MENERVPDEMAPVLRDSAEMVPSGISKEVVSVGETQRVFGKPVKMGQRVDHDTPIDYKNQVSATARSAQEIVNTRAALFRDPFDKHRGAFGSFVTIHPSSVEQGENMLRELRASEHYEIPSAEKISDIDQEYFPSVDQPALFSSPKAASIGSWFDHNDLQFTAPRLFLSEVRPKKRNQSSGQAMGIGLYKLARPDVRFFSDEFNTELENAFLECQKYGGYDDRVAFALSQYDAEQILVPLERVIEATSFEEKDLNDLSRVVQADPNTRVSLTTAFTPLLAHHYGIDQTHEHAEKFMIQKGPAFAQYIAPGGKPKTEWYRHNQLSDRTEGWVWGEDTPCNATVLSVEPQYGPLPGVALARDVYGIATDAVNKILEGFGRLLGRDDRGKQVPSGEKNIQEIKSGEYRLLDKGK